MAAIAEQADLEDSNIAGIGSDENRELRKAAAESDENFKGIGQVVGLQIWRVENKRTEADTPDFGVNHWPKEEYGNFYSGDCYLVLNTYKEKGSDKILWDVHFWIGESSTQDEKGVAAYKAIEIDDILNDGPIQHREVMGHESGLFQSYFKSGMEYLEGGIESGFRTVKAEEYVPRLLHVRKTKRSVRAFQVDCKATSLNSGDVFILDAGLTVSVWTGDSASPFEKAKAGTLAHNIITSRLGKAKRGEVDDAFWAVLGGTEADVMAAEEHDAVAEDIEESSCSMFRLSDSSGTLDFSKVGDSPLSFDSLDQNDVFVIDAVIEVFVWIGGQASKDEKSHGMLHAQQYIDSRDDRPSHTPITRIKAGQVNSTFMSCFK